MTTFKLDTLFQRNCSFRLFHPLLGGRRTTGVFIPLLWRRTDAEHFSYKNNHFNPNIVDISSALFIERFQYECTQIKWEEGASDIKIIKGLQWFKCLWWHLAFEHASFDLKSKCLWYTAEHALKIELSLFLHESDSCRLNLSCYWQDFHSNDSKSTLERSKIFKIPKHFKVLSPKGLAVMSRPLLNRGSLVRLYIRRSFVGLFMIIRVRITRLHTNSKLNTS